MRKYLEIKEPKDYFLLHEIIKNKMFGFSQIVLDLRQHNFFNPVHIVTLVQFVIFIQKKNIVVELLISSNKYCSYLENIGMLDFCRLNYEFPKIVNINRNNTFIPVHRLNVETMTEYIWCAENFFKQFTPNKDLSVLNLSISELVNNVIDHAQSEIDAYIFCQYYTKKQEFNLVVSDMGIGIPQSVNNFMENLNKPKLQEPECIKWALGEFKTTKTMPHNQGRGLFNIYNFCKGINRSLRIFSNNAIFTMINGIEKFTKSQRHIVGTIVEIKFKKDILNELDTDELFEF